MSNILEVRNLSKSYIQASSELNVLSGINLQVLPGETIAIVGASGSGKSTLLQIIGLLDNKYRGEIILGNTNVKSLTEAERDKIRLYFLGFVYQYHHLLSELTVLENIILPAQIANVPYHEAKKNATHLLEQVELTDKINNLPGELSGGQRQRVAIIRALINSPRILLADEPTGNLDPQSGEKVFELIKNIGTEYKLASIIVTHNMELASKADKIYKIHQGHLEHST